MTVEFPTPVHAMRIESIESLVAGKINEATCEDGVVVTDDFAAVVDGSTSKSSFQLHPTLSNGQYAMQKVCEVVGSLPRTTSLEEFCKTVTQQFQETFHFMGIDLALLSSHPENRPTASAAIYSRYREEIWLVGDCQCLVNNVFHDNPKPHESSIAAHRARLIEQWLHEGKESISSLRIKDRGREMIVQDIVATCSRQNKDFAVIDGWPIAIEKVKVIVAGKAAEIVLSTDGYPWLYPSLARTESALKKLLEEDPLCIRTYQATKGQMAGYSSFDDRCYLRIKVHR